ncbi:metal-dependent hydrolase [Bacillus sp. OxB-1]|uniref:rRNA maturation RNase YbeY n=1 Tax=Bacillus sp. (strain OxB-1) TaxID=98228 RepID=UPI000581F065|nr:rRNA maturation RNase YbeY [Bacillus sp. OxB-1]BAQ11411.1 metal-dependent hydrolase [Bacillus sp. OxB-1]
MLELFFEDETGMVDPEMEELIRNLLNHAAEAEQLEGSPEVSITFVTDSEIQKINAEYRGKDVPTDVISFALEEMSEGEVAIVGENLPTVLGDIIISVETAQNQAAEYGHEFNRELGFLALHGFLHLLGYDHMTEEEEKVMFGKQKEILDSFGLGR